MPKVYEETGQGMKYEIKDKDGNTLMFVDATNPGEALSKVGASQENGYTAIECAEIDHERSN